jgi:hypothetical protein
MSNISETPVQVHYLHQGTAVQNDARLWHIVAAMESIKGHWRQTLDEAERLPGETEMDNFEVKRESLRQQFVDKIHEAKSLGGLDVDRHASHDALPSPPSVASSLTAISAPELSREVWRTQELSPRLEGPIEQPHERRRSAPSRLYNGLHSGRRSAQEAHVVDSIASDRYDQGLMTRSVEKNTSAPENGPSGLLTPPGAPNAAPVLPHFTPSRIVIQEIPKGRRLAPVPTIPILSPREFRIDIQPLDFGDGVNVLPRPPAMDVGSLNTSTTAPRRYHTSPQSMEPAVERDFARRVWTGEFRTYNPSMEPAILQGPPGMGMIQRGDGRRVPRGELFVSQFGDPGLTYEQRAEGLEGEKKRRVVEWITKRETTPDLRPQT